MSAKDELEGVRPYLQLKTDGCLATTPFSSVLPDPICPSVCLLGLSLLRLTSASTMLAVVQ